MRSALASLSLASLQLLLYIRQIGEPMQDAIELSGGGGPFEAPEWSTDDLAVARKALSDIAVLGFDASYAFGRKEEVRPVDHLVGAAAGWGGLPKTAPCMRF